MGAKIIHAENRFPLKVVRLEMKDAMPEYDVSELEEVYRKVVARRYKALAEMADLGQQQEIIGKALEMRRDEVLKEPK